MENPLRVGVPTLPYSFTRTSYMTYSHDAMCIGRGRGRCRWTARRWMVLLHPRGKKIVPQVAGFGVIVTLVHS